MTGHSWDTPAGRRWGEQIFNDSPFCPVSPIISWWSPWTKMVGDTWDCRGQEEFLKIDSSPSPTGSIHQIKGPSADQRHLSICRRAFKDLSLQNAASINTCWESLWREKPNTKLKNMMLCQHINSLGFPNHRASSYDVMRALQIFNTGNSRSTGPRVLGWLRLVP